MRTTSLNKLARLLNRPEIPAHVQIEIVNAMRNTSKSERTSIAWKRIFSILAADKRSIVNNQGKRPEYLKQVYAEYLALIEKVHTRMKIAQLHGSPEDAERAAAKLNADRAHAGEPPLGACSTHWATWIPPKVREDFCHKVTVAYEHAGRRVTNKFIPFCPPNQRRVIHTMIVNLKKAIKRVRSRHESYPGANHGYTPYRALYLAAARMAERGLDKITKGYELGALNPIDNPPPVNWLALVEPAMRARLRAAQENPHDVDLQGLETFYAPLPDNTPTDELDATDQAHASTHPLEDMED